MLTDTRIRKYFSKIDVKLKLFHLDSFKRSGATLACNVQVSLDHIKDHDPWTSNCVWSYIKKITLLVKILYLTLLIC